MRQFLTPICIAPEDSPDKSPSPAFFFSYFSLIDRVNVEGYEQQGKPTADEAE